MIERVLDQLLNPSAVVLMAEIIVGLLIVATLAIEILARLKPKLNMTELRARTRSWWVMATIFIVIVVIDWRESRTAMAILLAAFALVSYLALKEFYTLVHLRLADRRAILLAYLSIPVQYWWVYTGWYGMFIIFVPVYMFLITAARLVVTGETQRFVTSVGKLHWGLMAFVFGLSHMAYFFALPEIKGFEAGGRGLLLYVVFLAQFNDVLQFMFGKALGKHKLAPTVSPGKTWEGWLGGMVCTCVLAVLLRFLTPMDVSHALMAGIIIATLGPLGDLIASAIKRDVGVKDFSALIPGHGGILDRVDSLCFSVPIFFHFVRHFYYP